MNKPTTQSKGLRGGWFRPGKSGYVFYPVGWQGWLISFLWLMLVVSLVSALTLWIRSMWLSYAASVVVVWVLWWGLQMLARRNKSKRTLE